MSVRAWMNVDFFLLRRVPPCRRNKKCYGRMPTGLHLWWGIIMSFCNYNQFSGDSYCCKGGRCCLLWEVCDGKALPGPNYPFLISDKLSICLMIEHAKTDLMSDSQRRFLPFEDKFQKQSDAYFSSSQYLSSSG